MRRVHTDAGTTEGAGDETEEDGSERAGMKRKRGLGRNDDGEIRSEMARLRNENEELRRQADLQTQQTSERKSTSSPKLSGPLALEARVFTPFLR
jgi:hypothetical protein